MTILKFSGFIFVFIYFITTYGGRIGWIEVSNKCSNQPLLSIFIRPVGSACSAPATTPQKINYAYSQIFASLDNQCPVWQLLGASENYFVPINTKVILRNGVKNTDCICTLGCASNETEAINQKAQKRVAKKSR